MSESPGGSRVVWGSLLAVALAAAVVACGSAPQPVDADAVETLGQECGGVGDIAPGSHFDDIAAVFRLDTEALRNSLDGNDNDRPALAALLADDPEIVYSNGAELPDVVQTNPVDSASLTRLPSGMTALVATRIVAYPTRSQLVQFVVVEQQDDAVVFIGDCADRLYQGPVRRYRKTAHPDLSPRELFLLLVSDPAVQDDYEDFFTYQGRFTPGGA